MRSCWRSLRAFGTLCVWCFHQAAVLLVPELRRGTDDGWSFARKVEAVQRAGGYGSSIRLPLLDSAPSPPSIRHQSLSYYNRLMSSRPARHYDAAVIMARAGDRDALAQLADVVGLEQLTAPAGFDFQVLLAAVAGGLRHEQFAFRKHVHTIKSILIDVRQATGE